MPHRLSVDRRYVRRFRQSENEVTVGDAVGAWEGLFVGLSIVGLLVGLDIVGLLVGLDTTGLADGAVDGLLLPPPPPSHDPQGSHWSPGFALGMHM